MKKDHLWWMVLLLLILVGGIAYSGYVYFDEAAMLEAELAIEEDTVLKKESEEEFISALSVLVRRYDRDHGGENEEETPYFSKRLIVQSFERDVDLTGYGAQVIIQGPKNVSVMQFATEEAAKEAHEELLRVSDIEYCEPDQYLEKLEWDLLDELEIPFPKEDEEISSSLQEESLQIDPKAAYAAVIEEYKEVAEGYYDSALLDQAQYINEGARNFAGWGEHSLYYQFVDLAEDGVPELLISTAVLDEPPQRLLDIYGLEDGVPVRLIESNGSVCYRSQYYLTRDGRIKNQGSGGAANAEICYYRLPENSVSFVLEDQYIYDGWNGNQYTHIDANQQSENISEEEYLRIDSEEDVAVDQEWERLYEGRVTHAC